VVLGKNDRRVAAHAGKFEGGKKLKGAGEGAEGATRTRRFGGSVLEQCPNAEDTGATVVFFSQLCCSSVLLTADLFSLLLSAAPAVAATATVAMISTTHRAKQIINHGMRPIRMKTMPLPRGRRDGRRE